MENKSDSSPCEDGLSKKLSVRKVRSTRGTSYKHVSVGAQTTLTALGDQTKTSNPDSCKEKLVGCDVFSAKLGNICVKKEYVSSEDEDTFSGKGEYVSYEEDPSTVKREYAPSEEGAKSAVKAEYVSSEEEEPSSEKGENVSSGQGKLSFREGEMSIRAGNTSSRKKRLKNTGNATDTRHKQGQELNRRREISEDIRRQVVEAHKSGKGYKRIAKDLDLNLSTVRTIVYKWRKFSTVATLPRSGRPTKISAKARHTILKHMRENTRVTVKDLKASLALDNINVHESTIRKTMSKWCSWDFTVEEAAALQQE